MDELRELILSHLEELHGTGLSDERYQLYVDTVYQCDSIDKLIEMAALELQLEANEFVTQLMEQMPEDVEEAAYRDGSGQEDIDLCNSDGFGDGFEDNVQDENYCAESIPDAEEDAIDPEVLEIQQALMGGNEDISDPSYFDIDALLAKGSVSPPTTPVTYHDALADLLATYPQDNTTEDDVEEIVFDDPALFAPQEPTAVGQSDIQGFGQPHKPSGFAPPPPQGFGLPSGFSQTSGFGQIPPLPQGFGNPNKPYIPVPQQPVQQQPVQQQPVQQKPVAQQQVQQPQRPQPAAQSVVQQKPVQNSVRNVFADFSKRKTPNNG